MRTGHNIHRIGNIAWLRAEQQNVSRLVFDVGIQFGGVRGERDDARIRHGFHQILKIRVQYHVGHVVVVQSGTAQFRIAQIESERLHQMQNRAGHRA